MRERFAALDALRGVAALAVLSLHFSLGSFPQHGYLAVDIFFVLSGFVIAHAYGKRLNEGLTVRRFTVLRAIRLYPLVWLGVGLSVALEIAFHLLGRGDTFTVPQVLCALLLLPYITASSADMYVVLSPTWSLFNELVVNVAYAAVAKFLTDRVLLGCCAICAAILIPVTLMHHSVQFGPFRGTLLMGMIRTFFSFSAGVMIYRFRSHPSLRSGWAVAGTAAALAVFAVPELGPWNGAFEAATVAIVIPAIVALLAHVRLDGRAARFSAFLGDLSYPVYVLHWPLRGALFATGVQTHVPLPVFLLLSVIMVSAAAFFALKLYDEPVRKALGKSGAPAHPVTVP